MAEIRVNATGGLKLYDADDSHYAQIVAGTITSNTDVMTLGHAAVVMGTKLDMNGSNLVLDADADTYLDTGTDDTIKVYVSGAHDLTIGANAINVLSGTTLTIDSGATITNSGTANGFSSADPSSADGDALGTASAEWSDLYLADSSVIYFGNDQDTTLTHTDGTGLTLNSTNKLTFGDVASFIQQSSDGVLKIDGEATVDINATAAVTIADSTVPVTVGGIPFYRDSNSIYTHDVSGTDNTAQNNTAFGAAAMDAITDGDDNTAFGYRALGANTTGAQNCAIGDGALYQPDTENNNAAFGYAALSGAIAGGENNTSVGNFSGDAITSGDENSLLGYYAGSSITTGANNTYLGRNAGDATTTGSNNICIGSGSNPTANDVGSAIAIGSVTAASDDFSFGRSGNVVTNDFDADANWSRSSDVRKKREIYDQGLGLDFINDLRTVRFQWKPSNEFPKEWQDYNEENNMNLDVIMHGFIAQEVKEALDKHAINNDKEFSGWKEGGDGMQHTSREMFVIPLIKAMQELSAQVTTLQDEIKTLKGE